MILKIISQKERRIVEIEVEKIVRCGKEYTPKNDEIILNSTIAKNISLYRDRCRVRKMDIFSSNSSLLYCILIHHFNLVECGFSMSWRISEIYFELKRFLKKIEIESEFFFDDPLDGIDFIGIKINDKISIKCWSEDYLNIKIYYDENLSHTIFYQGIADLDLIKKKLNCLMIREERDVLLSPFEKERSDFNFLIFIRKIVLSKK